MLPSWCLRLRYINGLGWPPRRREPPREARDGRGRPLAPPTLGGRDPPPRQTSGGPATGNEALLIPLARAQDAVARLEASVAAAPDDVAAGLRARLALFEAAGFLAHCGPAVHPHDLALRDTNLTGSYTLAALTGRLREAAPWTIADGADADAADDHLVAHALAYARHWRRLAELATAAASICGEFCGAAGPTRGAARRRRSDARLARSPAGPTEGPGLLAAARVMASGLPGMPRGNRLELGAAYVAAALWRRHGYGRGCALPFWAAPVSRIEALARQGGGEFALGYLTASPRRHGAGHANLPDCRKRRAELPRCRQGAAPDCKQPAPSRCASPSSPDACSPRGSMSRPAPGWISLPGWSLPACCAR